MIRSRPTMALILARAAIGLACTGLATGCNNSADNFAADAAAAFARQDYFAARDEALQALRSDPLNAGSLEVLARAQLAMGLGDEVLATLDRLAAVEALPDDAALLRAEAHLQRGDLAAAAQVLAELAPGQVSADAWRLHAFIAWQQDDLAGAREAFAKGRAAEGDKLRLVVAEASFHLAQDNAEAAREPVALARQIAPERIETHFVTARLAQYDDDTAQATSAFLAILDLSPLDRPALLGAIDGLGELERIDELRPLIDRGLANYPNDPEFLYFAGLVKATDGDWAGVRDLFQQREGELADHPPSRGLYAEALLELGQNELARSTMVPLYRQFPDNDQVVRTFARALLATGDRARAQDVLAPLLARDAPLPQDRELAALASSQG